MLLAGLDATLHRHESSQQRPVVLEAGHLQSRDLAVLIPATKGDSVAMRGIRLEHRRLDFGHRPAL